MADLDIVGLVAVEIASKSVSASRNAMVCELVFGLVVTAIAIVGATAVVVVGGDRSCWC